MRVSREYLVAVAEKAAFPGLPQCMTADEARRRIVTAVDAILPYIEDGESDAYNRGYETGFDGYGLSKRSEGE